MNFLQGPTVKKESFRNMLVKTFEYLFITTTLRLLFIAEQDGI